MAYIGLVIKSANVATPATNKFYIILFSLFNLYNIRNLNWLFSTEYNTPDLYPLKNPIIPYSAIPNKAFL